MNHVPNATTSMWPKRVFGACDCELTVLLVSVRVSVVYFFFFFFPFVSLCSSQTCVNLLSHWRFRFFFLFSLLVVCSNLFLWHFRCRFVDVGKIMCYCIIRDISFVLALLRCVGAQLLLFTLFSLTFSLFIFDLLLLHSFIRPSVRTTWFHFHFHSICVFVWLYRYRLNKHINSAINEFFWQSVHYFVLTNVFNPFSMRRNQRANNQKVSNGWKNVELNERK